MSGAWPWPAEARRRPRGREVTGATGWRDEHVRRRDSMKACYLPGERAFLRFIEIPGGDPPLVWLHGWQCSSTGELLPAAVQDPLRGRRSLMVDFLGHGLSDRPPDFAYTLEEHARTIVALIDTLGLHECGLVGHSMGGAIAVLVATARANIVSLLIAAEPSIDGGGGAPLGGQAEDEFVARGFSELLDAQAAEAEAQPNGWRAAHLGMTRLVDPRALYREAVSLERGTNPSVRRLLASLQMPRWYLQGELSDPEPGLQHDVQEMGVGWKLVPKAGHPMGVQNPLGMAQTISEILRTSWSK